MKHSGTKTLETERLILRPFRMEDADAAFRNWESDDRVTKFLRWPTYTNVADTREVMRGWIEAYADPAYYHWAIVLKELGEPIGSISVVGREDKTAMAHVGYCIGSRWWHQGIVREAFAAVIDYLFREVGVNRIEAQHDPDNPRSGHVMQACGLTYEGTLRKADWSNRGIVDACVYSLLREEWQG